MATNLPISASNALLCLTFLLPLFFTQSYSDKPSTVCESTPYPSYCNVVLASDNSSSNVYDYTRFSVRKSISTAKKFLSLIEKNLHNPKKLSTTEARALEDCKYLAQSNIDNLVSTFDQISNQDFSPLQADDVQAILSATLTNIETCFDGLLVTPSASSFRDEILTPSSNDTRLYSVSLALFTKGWVPKRKNTQHFQIWKSLKLSNNRRLLQAVGNDTNNGTTTNPVLVSATVTVSQDGTGNFTTINDALLVAPNNTNGVNGYFVIYIKAGVYEEYVSIPKNKKYLMMLGDGINQTIITGNHSVVDGWTTFDCPTFIVVSPNFVAVNITFRNTAGPAKHQAVAVRNGADLSVFYLCSFEAYQDTLYVHSLRQFYRECDIYGTVDFIFGNAASMFQNCNIYPRLPMSNQFNAITAQGRTDPNQNTGISVHNCTIRAADDLANSNITIKTYLGRPWKQYSRTVYMESFMDSLITPVGWSIWSGDFALNTSYYAEYNNSGPGSNTTARVTWPGFHIINATDAINFTVSGFLLGDAWIPKTGVPFTGGLLSS